MPVPYRRPRLCRSCATVEEEYKKYPPAYGSRDRDGGMSGPLVCGQAVVGTLPSHYEETKKSLRDTAASAYGTFRRGWLCPAYLSKLKVRR